MTSLLKCVYFSVFEVVSTVRRVVATAEHMRDLVVTTTKRRRILVNRIQTDRRVMTTSVMMQVLVTSPRRHLATVHYLVAAKKGWDCR